MSADDAWKELAADSRQALTLLGWPITPKCLPGEPEACGATFAEHAWANLHALRAVADHHLTHVPVTPRLSAQAALSIIYYCRECR